jgi:hypothetical protein
MNTKPKTAIVYSCAHSDPDVSNERFSWLGSLIYDIKPDYVIDLGDGADMRSLNSYDTRYPKAVCSQSYESDIEHYNDAMERLQWKFKHHKKKKPRWIGFEGNHENRIKKAIGLDPRLEGSKYGISFSHLNTDHWFDEYHEYSNSAPDLVAYDGIVYGHYVASGNFGSAMATKHHGYSLVEKLASSATVGHTHKFHYYYKGDARPRPLHGLVVGCFKGHEESWAGQANHEWRKGVVIKREIQDGQYDLEWVSLDKLKREYSK